MRNREPDAPPEGFGLSQRRSIRATTRRDRGLPAAFLHERRKHEGVLVQRLSASRVRVEPGLCPRKRKRRQRL
jgi:hypothetical protein